MSEEVTEATGATEPTPEELTPETPAPEVAPEPAPAPEEVPADELSEKGSD